MARGPRNLRVAADGVGLTQFGGVALIEQFFQRIHLQGALWRHVRFAQRNNRYSISESLKALLYPLVLGLGRIETTEPLRYNGVFHYLAGLPGYPEATSLRRFLERFARSGRQALLQLHDRWRTAMLGPTARAIFDLDSTVLTVYGRQERAEVGYNPKKRGRPSYLPLLCFEGNTQDCWEGTYHPGDTHVSTITTVFHLICSGPPCNVSASACFWSRPSWYGPTVFRLFGSRRATSGLPTSRRRCGASDDCVHRSKSPGGAHPWHNTRVDRNPDNIVFHAGFRLTLDQDLVLHIGFGHGQQAASTQAEIAHA